MFTAKLVLPIVQNKQKFAFINSRLNRGNFSATHLLLSLFASGNAAPIRLLYFFYTLSLQDTSIRFQITFKGVKQIPKKKKKWRRIAYAGLTLSSFKRMVPWWHTESKSVGCCQCWGNNFFFLFATIATRKATSRVIEFIFVLSAVCPTDRQTRRNTVACKSKAEKIKSVTTWCFSVPWRRKKRRNSKLKHAGKSREKGALAWMKKDVFRSFTLWSGFSGSALYSVCLFVSLIFKHGRRLTR